MRCGERPTAMSPIGLGKCIVNPKNTSGERPGQKTLVNRANATATAAMVPVWMTTNRVQPYRYPNRGEMASRRYTRSEEHTSELQSPCNLVCRLLLEKKKKNNNRIV